MKQQHQDVINRMRPFLVDNLIISPVFLAHLVSMFIMSYDDQEHLMGERLTMREKALHFCRLIIQKGPMAFEAFMETLDRTDQGFIRAELERELMTRGVAGLYVKQQEQTTEKDMFCLNMSELQLLAPFIHNTHEGLTATQVAVDNDKVNMLSFLGHSGANMDPVDAEGQHLLHRAARVGNINMIEYLLNEVEGLSVNVVDYENRTPLHVSIMSGNSATSRRLIEKFQADISMLDTYKRDPLFLACQFGDCDAARILLDKGAVYTTKTSLSNTALDIACFNGFIDIARLLLDRGADVNICGDDGSTPLYVACYYGHAVVAELLLSAGAEVDARATDGTTSLHVASLHGHTEVAELLLNSGAHVDARETDGATPLHVASEHGHTTLVERLLNRGVQIDASATDGATPIHVASLHGHTEVVELLLSRGSQPDARRHDGTTPLHAACSQGRHEVVQLLLEKGADSSSQDMHGNTPLHYACQEGHTRTVQELLQHPTLDTHIVNNNNQTARQLAEARGHQKIMEILPRS